MPALNGRSLHSQEPLDTQRRARIDRWHNLGQRPRRPGTPPELRLRLPTTTAPAADACPAREPSRPLPFSSALLTRVFFVRPVRLGSVRPSAECSWPASSSSACGRSCVSASVTDPSTTIPRPAIPPPHRHVVAGRREPEGSRSSLGPGRRSMRSGDHDHPATAAEPAQVEPVGPTERARALAAPCAGRGRRC